MRSARVFEGITDTGSLSWQQCFSWLESFIFHKHKSWDINITKTVPTFLPDAFFQEIYTLASGTLTPKGMELLSNDYAEERKNCFPSDRDQRRRWTWSQVGIQWEMELNICYISIFYIRHVDSNYINANSRTPSRKFFQTRISYFYFILYLFFTQK